MIENEMLITLGGYLLVVLVVLLQMAGVGRAKSIHNSKITELEHAVQGNETALQQASKMADRPNKCSLFCHTGHLGQILLGLLLFVVFGCWAVYLAGKGLMDWASVTGAMGFIALVVPFIVWSEYKRRYKIVSRLLLDIETRQKAGQLGDKLAFLQEESASIQKAASLATPTISPVAEVADKVKLQQPEPVTQIVQAQSIAAETCMKTDRHETKIDKQAIPQDSVLKRHFVAHLCCQLEDSNCCHPTDSILKRHHDHYILNEMEKYVDEPAPIAQQVLNQFNSESLQNSLSQNHACSDIVTETAKDERLQPTDSILQRHFKQFLETDIADHYQNLMA